MDPDTLGLPATLFVYPDRVRIVAGRHDDVHPRQPPGGRSTLPKHRARHVAEVSGRRGKRYLKRQHLLELGDETFRYLSEIVHRRSAAWVADVDIMHELLQVVGDDALRAAVVCASEANLYGGEYVRWFVEQSAVSPMEPRS
jgi:hypothetical protein